MHSERATLLIHGTDATAIIFSSERLGIMFCDKTHLPQVALYCRKTGFELKNALKILPRSDSIWKFARDIQLALISGISFATTSPEYNACIKMLFICMLLQLHVRLNGGSCTAELVLEQCSEHPGGHFIKLFVSDFH